MTQHIRQFYITLFILLLLQPLSQVDASKTMTLGDYEQALRSNNIHRIQLIHSYIQGAVDTHLHYSKRLRNWTGFNALCTGKYNPGSQEIGAMIELKIMTLKRQYGNGILGMPMVEVVPMIVEDQFKCF